MVYDTAARVSPASAARPPTAKLADAETAVAVAAGLVRPGDRLLHEGREITVSGQPRDGHFWIRGEHAQGLAIDWKGHRSRGTLFRRAADTLFRLTEITAVSEPGGGS